MTDHSLPDHNSKPQQTGGTERQGFTLDPQARHDGSKEVTENEAVIGRRIVAFIIDASLLLFAGSLAILFSALSLIGLPLTWLLFALYPVVPLIYHIGFLASKGSATPGMRAMSLRAVRVSDEGRPDFVQATIMVILFYASIATSGLLLLWCLFDKQSRCLHDIFSGTRIIRTNTES